MTNFNERIAELADLEAKATPGEWEGYDLSFCDQFIEQRISSDKGEIPVLSLNRENSENNQQFICALRNEALPLLREMAQALSEAQEENERLKKAAYAALNSLVDFRCPEDDISELVSVIDARDILSVQSAIKALDEVLD